MAFEIVRSRNSIQDLDLIFDHLVDSYIRLGEAPAEAVSGAAIRISKIKTDMNAIARVPYQGTLLNDLGAGMRSVTKSNAVFYFEIDEAAQIVRILAIFFGGQDHRQHMVKRLGRIS